MGKYRRNPNGSTSVFIVDSRYALFLTPNAYGGVLMRIFTPYLFFQCVFNDFQCVITLLRALSVALKKAKNEEISVRRCKLETC